MFAKKYTYLSIYFEFIKQEGQHSSKKHHHRRQLSTAPKEINVYKPHPLSITFKVNIRS